MDQPINTVYETTQYRTEGEANPTEPDFKDTNWQGGPLPTEHQPINPGQDANGSNLNVPSQNYLNYSGGSHLGTSPRHRQTEPSLKSLFQSIIQNKDENGKSKSKKVDVDMENGAWTDTQARRTQILDFFIILLVFIGNGLFYFEVGGVNKV